MEKYLDSALQWHVGSSDAAELSTKNIVVSYQDSRDTMKQN